jgi:DNA invertase Pin-like site-specific DNA recombinase
MAEYIYSRVSTDGQSTDPQVLLLKEKYPHAEVVTEVRSGIKSRPFLSTLLSQLKAGDILIVAALDRLGRKATDILTIIEDLERRRVILKSDREGVDYSTLTGRLVTQILASVAEMERNVISERTRAGLEVARKKGRLLGRPKRIPRETLARGISLVMDEGMDLREAASAVGVHFTYLGKLVRKKREDPSLHF